MAAVAATAANVGAIDPIKSQIKSYIANAAITRGQACYLTTAGKADLCDANGSGTLQFRGIALQTVGAGSPVELLQDGEVEGFDVAGLNVDALVYVGNTAGELADSAGSTAIVAGRVSIMTNTPTYTKVLRVFVKWEADWA
jgi:hypothetical protein